MLLKNILLDTANDLEDSALSDQKEIQSVQNFFQNDKNCQFTIDENIYVKKKFGKYIFYKE